MENISENPDEYREYILRRQQTGSEAAHFSFQYTNPAVFDIIKKLSSTHFRRKTIHPETEIILLLKSI